MKIFLIGFMGSGKSHWGSIWAHHHSLQFFDLDKIIEEAEGKSIADIFEINGETYFREKETMALHTLAGVDDCIVACGGGAPCFNDNMRWMKGHGTTVYLETSVNDIFDRVLQEQEKRPLIKKLNQAELRFFIEQTLKDRSPFYEMAEISIHSQELDEKIFSKKVLKKTQKKIK